MPELPEVETIRAQLEPALTDREIRSGWAFASPKFDDARLAVGARIISVLRRGKYLLLGLRRGEGPGDDLVIHLGMTGHLAVGDTPPLGVDGVGSRRRHLRASWELDDGRHLGFWDQRRFGRVAVVRSGMPSGLPTLDALGPEPFSDDFTPAGLREGLSGRKALKTALLDQRLVAGIGNIYADEALWLAGIRPTARRLGLQRAEALHQSIIDVLEAGLDDGGTTLRDYRDAAGDMGAHQERLRCYGRAGLECDRCGTRLSRKVIDGRSTTWCRSCQT